MNNVDVREIVTSRIIKSLEEGVVPWRKPWKAAGVPISVSTNKPYRGINHLILDVVGDSEGYPTSVWGTFKAFKEKGEQILKGEKATPIVFWKPVTRKKDDGVDESFMLMRYYNVFNLSQTTMTVPATQQGPVFTPTDAVQSVLNYANGPTVIHKECDRACYMEARDQITLPLVSQFYSEESYAGTVFHEAIHSTGHSTRLARDLNGVFGSRNYAREELIAEVGASMLAAHLGVKCDYEQSAAYVGSWLKVLQDDRGLILTAAQAAQKAVDHITGTSTESESEDE